ncbi:putative deoxyribonuclease YcfH [Enhygromyxa salina]|uniref:Putative deoxyribonuclease YcfH n=1 Tax=Enhygromyxa salina TaxID=215803 RepID=A0A0C2D277_9BACT|nr:TatD family hydrolase [Enhygromyxa salina]KIG17381.1 putative deoxyribonuclease YcfH [Enhygromyxa salina]
MGKNSKKPRPSPPFVAGLIDSHCHLDYAPMSDDLEATLARARAAGVEQCVHIGCSPDTMAGAVTLARAHPQVFASVGIHPHEARHLDDALLAEIEQLAAADEVVAIGETGLDYHYDLSPRAAQLQGFARQVELAKRLDLPLVLHIRDAHADAWALLADHPPRDNPGVVHCFTGTAAEAERWLELGWHISFSGIATFKTAAELRRAAARVPDDRIMLETDAPYLAPEPLRGRKNEPANVAFTCVALAQLRDQTPTQLAKLAADNTRRLLRLPVASV